MSGVLPVEAMFNGTLDMPAQITVASGDVREIRAIYKSAYSMMVLLGVSLNEAKPRMVCRTTDIEPIYKHGRAVTVAGKNFVMRNLETEGTGLSRVILENV